ncbi:MAG: hypothetical protein UMU76_08435 [Prosthecochloris sp.]|nr:hypothetical protein [Prosthecochloris sp.]
MRKLRSFNCRSNKEFLQSFNAGDAVDRGSSLSSPLFSLSSAFPFSSKGREYCYWLPKPLSVPFSFSHENTESSREIERSKFGKLLKKTPFISREIFSCWQSFAEPVGHKLDDDSFDTSGKSEIRPQVAIDRISSRSNLFHSGVSYFDSNDEQEGLYVLCRTSDNRVMKALDEVLGVISEAGGIGGDISSGCGELAKYSIDPVTEGDPSWTFLNGCDGANASCLLSLCVPGNMTDLSGRLVAYSTVLRKGWTGSVTTNIQRKRKTVYMLSEGTVLIGHESGSMVPVTPDIQRTPEWKGLHNVYRYGLAFSVPIRVNLED